MRVWTCKELRAKHDRTSSYLRPPLLGTPLAPSGLTSPTSSQPWLPGRLEMGSTHVARTLTPQGSPQAPGPRPRPQDSESGRQRLHGKGQERRQEGQKGWWDAPPAAGARAAAAAVGRHPGPRAPGFQAPGPRAPGPTQNPPAAATICANPEPPQAKGLGGRERPLRARKLHGGLAVSSHTRGRRLHTGNRHLRNHRGFSVASSNLISLVSSIFPKDCHFSSNGSSWNCPLMFSGIFQRSSTFAISGV